MDAGVITFILYMLLILGMGVYFTRRVQSYKDFIIGGRRFGPWVSSFSLISSYMSGYTYTAAPGMGYTQGFSSLWWASGDAPGNSLSFGLLGRRLRKYTQMLDAITVPEFYEKRFKSPVLRLIASLIVLVFVGTHLVGQWQASGILLQVTFGTEYFTGLLIGGVVVLLYTLLGGYIAVMYTDALQGVVMFIGSQILFWLALFYLGGFGSFVDNLAALDTELVTPWGPGGEYFGIWAVAYPVLLILMGSLGYPHITVRHLSLRRPSTARKAMLITCILVVLFSFAYYLTGGLALTILGEGLEDVEQAAVRLWFYLLPPVLAGILSSAAIASIMSTADSFLILLTTTVAHDLLYKFISPDALEEQRTKWARILAAVLGVITFVIAIDPPALVFEIVIFAMGGMGLAFGIPNLFSVYWKRTSAFGVLLSMVLTMLIYVGGTVMGVQPLGLHPFVAALIVGVLAIVLGSLFTEPPEAEEFEEAADYVDLPEEVAQEASPQTQFQAESALALLVGSRRSPGGGEDEGGEIPPADPAPMPTDD